MTERVHIAEGKNPIIIVAPHGFKGDDENTDILAKQIAYLTKAYLVVNQGWERAEKVDYWNDKADCNNVYHCHEDVVKEEFLQPILRFRNRLFKQNPKQTVYIYLIHGMSHKHRVLSGDPQMDMVIGYGAGKPDSFSCDVWRKNAFMHLLEESGINVYEGKKEGPMSGWSRNNLNQLFTKWLPDPNVQSLQIEIIHDLRSDFDMAQITAEYLAAPMLEMLDKLHFKSSKQYKQY